MEEQIEEAFTSGSVDEMEYAELLEHPHSQSCCGAMQEEEDETTAQRQLKRFFTALKIQQYCDFVKENATFAILSAFLLVCSGSASHFAAKSAAYGHVLRTFGQACIISVYTILGVPAAVDLTYNLAESKVNIFVLTVLAVFAAAAVGSPLEGGLLLVLFEAAHIIEGKLTNAAKGDLNALLRHAPKSATIIELSPGEMQPIHSTEKVVKVSQVKVGQHILVRAGELVPLDGIIVNGRSMISSENITGESLPYLKSIDESVPAGSRSIDGTVVIRTTHTAEESTPVRIARLAAAAQLRKPMIKQTLDQYIDSYSKGVLVCTLAIMLCLPILKLPFLGQNGSFYRAAAFLTASAPCALVMAPLAYVASISAMARKGVIVRGGRILDAIAECDSIALDKTGTLTEGKLKCNGIMRLNGAEHNIRSPVEDAESLQFALALSQRSTHPVSAAVKECSSNEVLKGSSSCKIDDFRMIPGFGVEGTASMNGGGDVYSVKFGSVNYVAPFLPDASVARLRDFVDASGQDKVVSILHVTNTDNSLTNGNSGNITSVFTFSDKIRSKCVAAIDDLQNARDQKLKVMMLTGDHVANAQGVAGQLGIKHVYAGLLPEEKLSMVEKARNCVSKTGVVAMVGDGINDAPALAFADVGIAFANTTSDAAASAADAIVLQEGGDHISVLPYLFRVARRTRQIVRQNVMLATVSIMGTSLCSLLGYFPLWLSVSLHEGSTLGVALNSLRCLLPAQRAGSGKKKSYLIATVLFACATIAFFVSRTALSGAGNAVLMLESASAGLFAGALHSLTGPDHLAALAPLSIGRSSASAGFLGGLWGLGHSVGQLFFGALFILLKSSLQSHLNVIEQFAGAAVGITLIFIGVVGYKEGRDFSDSGMTAMLGSTKRSKFTWTTFGTGFLHGLSPDAILPVLPALTLSAKGSALAFVVAFLVGTVGSMASYTAFIGVGSSALAQRSPNITRKISMGSSAIALLLGVALIVSSMFGVEVLKFH